MSAETKEQHPPLPDPKEVAKTYAEVAQRASKLLTTTSSARSRRVSPRRRMNWGWPRPSWT